MKRLYRHAASNKLYFVAIIPSWMYLTFYTDWAQGQPLSGIEYNSPMYWASCIAMLAVLLAFAFVPRKLGSLLASKPFFIWPPMALALSTLLLLVPHALYPEGVRYLCSALTGLASAIMTLQWASLLGKR